jgi:hypothetical protein
LISWTQPDAGIIKVEVKGDFVTGEHPHRIPDLHHTDGYPSSTVSLRPSVAAHVSASGGNNREALNVPVTLLIITLRRE